MEDTEKHRARAKATEDQAWANAESLLPEIEQIAAIGITTDRETEIARMCCCLVSSRVRMILDERNQREKNQESDD